MIKFNRILLALLKVIGACFLWLAVFIASWGFYFLGLFFTLNSDWLPAIISLLFALTLEFKKFVAYRIRKRPKDILKRINIGRFDSVTVKYGRRWSPELGKERAAYQNGFDTGCDFILNLEEK